MGADNRHTAAMPLRIPTAVGAMNREQLDVELQKGFDSMKTGIVYTPEELEERMKREFEMEA